MSTINSQLQHIYQDAVQTLQEGKFREEYFSSLFKGPWGALLFLFYYEQYVDTEADNATALLEKIYGDYAPEEGTNFSFCNGHTGPFWLLDHLSRHDFIDMDVHALAEDFVTAAMVQNNYQIHFNNFDYLHGSAGIVHFLLGFAHRQDVRNHLEEFVTAVNKFSETTDLGRSLPFFYTHDEENPVYVNSFSLAHGSCAVLIILSKIYQLGIAQDACRTLINESLEFMIAHRNKVEVDSMHALYPAIMDGKTYNSRLAWCYGDLNVAIAMWYCGKTLGEQRWMDEGVDIMRYNSHRKTNLQAGIVDNCLCHGSAGIAAFYLRFWHETKEQLFYDCAMHWNSQAVADINFSEEGGKAGIKVWQGKERDWDYAWDLLDGAVGVGLSMISHEQQKPLAWDECFLLS
ncbi:lanthionine synthetase LanC family protein [Chitinophaga solisilvae]|uniref:lanthionine synthetase LanC family protein n=1 Tax=Chitinophaga solisilvae TaxID=1233460 RepID=UPI0013709774|nr:lanthionine synthetase LanC family protein [Chitinophaga solisilvae]